LNAALQWSAPLFLAAAEAVQALLIYFFVVTKELVTEETMNHKSEADSRAELVASGQSHHCPEKDA
jgi:hypothetical protein